MLGQMIANAVIGVQHADGDADLLIVTTTLSLAKECPVSLVGEDTDGPTDSLVLPLQQGLTPSSLHNFER